MILNGKEVDVLCSTVSTLLEIQPLRGFRNHHTCLFPEFQPFLRFNLDEPLHHHGGYGDVSTLLEIQRLMCSVFVGF